MKVSQERLAGSRVALTVEVEPDQVSQATDRAYQRLGNQVMVPGFRRGKAPRHILRTYVGEQRVRQETLDNLLPDAYRQALQESGIAPIAEPEVDIVSMEHDQPLSFKATVPVMPTVELGDYRTIRVARQPVEVTEEQIDAVIEDLRKQHAEWSEVTNRGIEPGDRIVADIRCEVEGEAIIDSKDQELTAGENALPKEVDEGLVGTAAGEERTVLSTLPADYPRQDLAGKEATYTVAVKSIKQPNLPPVDDALAQKVPGVADLAALRADIRQRLQASGEASEEERLRTKVIEELIARSKLDYPAVLVERQLDRSLETFAANVARQGFDPDQYIRMIGMTPEQLRDRWRPDAEDAVKRDLVLEEVAKQEGIEPTDEQTTEEVQRIAGDLPAEQVPRLTSANPRLLRAVQSSVRDRLALDRLLAFATEAAPPEDSSVPAGPVRPAEEPSGLNAATEPAASGAGEAPTANAAEPGTTSPEQSAPAASPQESRAKASSTAPTGETVESTGE